MAATVATHMLLKMTFKIQNRLVPAFVLILTLSVVTSFADPECYRDHGSQNVAINKATYASSGEASSHFLVDGDRAEVYPARCLQTSSEENPWLVVDLDETTAISTVVITAVTPYTTQALGQYEVLVGESFNVSSFTPSSSGYIRCNSRPVDMYEREVLYVQCGKTLVGRFVLIFTQRVTQLHICEVEVYKEQVFQAEKWTCIVPERHRANSLLNIAKGKPSSQINTGWGGYAWKGNDGNDNPYYGASCTHTKATPSWWKVNLGEVYAVIGVAITNRRSCCYDRLSNFQVRVGNASVLTEYGVCAYNCHTHPETRRYYTCTQPLYGNHLAIYSTTIYYLTLCEVEVYSDDKNNVAFSSHMTNNNITLLYEELLYDDDDTTCIFLGQEYPSPGLSSINMEIPWDPTARTGVAARTGNYYCKKDFYVNVTYSVGIELSVTVSEEEIDKSDGSSWTYKGKSCDVIGDMESEGLTRIRYACFCEVKCWVFILVKHPRNMNADDGRLCTINVYD